MPEYLMFEPTKCANGMCTNTLGTVPWCLVRTPARTNLPALQLSMCAPCATSLSHEMERKPTDG